MARSPFYWLDQFVRLKIVGRRLLPVIEQKIGQVIPNSGITFLWLDQHRNISNVYDETLLKQEDPYESLRQLLLLSNDLQWALFCKQLLSKQTISVNSLKSLIPKHLGTRNCNNCVAVGVQDERGLGGILIIHRDKNFADFSVMERQLISDLGERLSLLLSPNSDSNETDLSPEYEGILFVDRNLNINYICSYANKLLFLLNHSEINNALLNSDRTNIDICEYTIENHLKENLQNVFANKNVQIKYLTNGWGKFRMQCNYLQMTRTESKKLHDFALIKIELLKPLALMVPQRAKELSLSKREAEVCLHLIDSESYSHIGDQLNISKHTVSTHMKNIFTKLNVKNRYELITVLRDGSNQEVRVM